MVHHCNKNIIFWLCRRRNQRFFFRRHKFHKTVFEPTTAGPYHEAFAWPIWINQDDTYKALRASQVKNSEINVPKVIDAVENLYLSPFSLELQCSNNYSFSSGKMFEGDIDDLLKIQQQGKETAHKFFEERIFSFRVSFHDTIQTIKPSLFGDEFFETQQKKQSSEILKTSRDVLGKLLWLSARYEKSFNFFEAL